MGNSVYVFICRSLKAICHTGMGPTAYGRDVGGKWISRGPKNFGQILDDLWMTFDLLLRILACTAYGQLLPSGIYQGLRAKFFPKYFMTFG